MKEGNGKGKEEGKRLKKGLIKDLEEKGRKLAKGII